VAPLEATHDVDSFDCGSDLLDTYLTRYALAEQTSAKIRTYVLIEDTHVIGYYSVGAGVVEAALTRDRIDRRQRRQVVPVLIAARMAVDCTRQRHGIGGALLRQAEARGFLGLTARVHLSRELCVVDVLGSALVRQHRDVLLVTLGPAAQPEPPEAGDDVSSSTFCREGLHTPSVCFAPLCVQGWWLPALDAVPVTPSLAKLLYTCIAQSTRGQEPRVWVSWGRHGFDGAHV